MKKIELHEARKTYQKSVDAYSDVETALRAAGRAFSTVPRMQRARRLILAADSALKKLGNTVAFVIETTDQLEEQQKINESIRQQAEAAGLTLRYDVPSRMTLDRPEPRPGHDGDLEERTAAMTTRNEGSSMSHDFEGPAGDPPYDQDEAADELDLAVQLHGLVELLRIKAPTHSPERAERLEHLANLAERAGWELEGKIVPSVRFEPEPSERKAPAARQVPFIRRPS